jgi:hypothetical protein
MNSPFGENAAKFAAIAFVFVLGFVALWFFYLGFKDFHTYGFSFSMRMAFLFSSLTLFVSRAVYVELKK